MGWKSLLAEAKSLTKNNGVNAWRTALIVRELMRGVESDAFLHEGCGGILENRDSQLASLVGRFALSVSDMENMLNYFPDKRDWERGRLDILRDDATKALGRDFAKTHQIATKRTPYAQVKKERKELEEEKAKIEAERLAIQRQKDAISAKLEHTTNATTAIAAPPRPALTRPRFTIKPRTLATDPSNGTNGHSQPPFPYPNDNGQLKRPVVEREPYEPRKDYSRGVAEANPLPKSMSRHESVEADLEEVWQRAMNQHKLTSDEVFAICGKLHGKHKK